MRKSFVGLLVLGFAMTMVSTALFAAKKGGGGGSGGTGVAVEAVLMDTCPNCSTDAGGTYYGDIVPRPYSLVSDGYSYPNGDPLVQANILTHNAVYTLDTTATLVNGYVASSTRTVNMHFFSPVECLPGGPCPYPDNVLPSCWGVGNYDQDQAVNWSIFAPTSFLKMAQGTSYQGMARLNFNVRNADCDRQLNRFRVEWGVVCIVKTGTGWTVTSGVCGAQTNYGEAHLEAYGGKKNNTVDYGDWRMPFKLNLTAPQ